MSSPDSDARAEILDRLRTALARPQGSSQPAEAGDSPTPVRYRRRGDRSLQHRRDVFVDRLEDYRAQVVPSGAERKQVRRAVAATLTEHGVTRVVAPARVAREWLGDAQGTDGSDASAPSVIVDHSGLQAADLAEVDAVLTGCALGIAETGVIVLDGGAWSGRRLVSLVPDVHLCVVRMEDVVDLPPEAIERLDPRAPQTWVAGPSATSDIELERVEGVHGPRTLVVILAG
ncbi:MAG: LUD domain-containing protein [Ornithinimicrobium sp.]